MGKYLLVGIDGCSGNQNPACSVGNLNDICWNTDACSGGQGIKYICKDGDPGMIWDDGLSTWSTSGCTNGPCYTKVWSKPKDECESMSNLILFLPLHH